MYDTAENVNQLIISYVHTCCRSIIFQFNFWHVALRLKVCTIFGDFFLSFFYHKYFHYPRQHHLSHHHFLSVHLTSTSHPRSARWHAIYIIEAQFHSLSIADSTQRRFCREINCRHAHSTAHFSLNAKNLCNFFNCKVQSRKNHITLLPFGAMIVLSHRGFLKPSGCMPGKICNVICSIASLCMNFNDFASRGFFNSSIISRSHCVTAAMSVWEIEMRKKEDGKNWILPLWKYNWKTDRKFRFFFVVCKKQLN